MKKIAEGFAALTLVMLLVAGSTAQHKLRIGVYDSRSIAIAYGNSNEMKEFIGSLRADLAKAKDAKDENKAKEIELKGRTAQVLGHLQAFSIGSVAEILAKHNPEIDQIAKDMKLEAIVAKHELMCLGAGAETVDLTSRLVQIFKPGAQAMKWIEGVPAQKPLPMLEVLSIPPEQ